MTSTTSRERLPDRRPNQTRELTWAGSDDHATTYTVTIGFQLDGTPAELLHSMGRAPVSGTETKPTSVIGAVVEALAEGLAVPAPEAETTPPSPPATRCVPGSKFQKFLKFCQVP